MPFSSSCASAGGELVVNAGRQQVLASSFGRLELRAADTELLRARELQIVGACLGVWEFRHSV